MNQLPQLGPVTVEKLLDAVTTQGSQQHTVYWRVQETSLELHAKPMSDGGDRMMTISCGIALHRAQVVFAAYGTRATVAFDGRDDLYATITPDGPHSITAGDTAMYQALLEARPKPLRGGELATADTATLLSRAVRPWGVRIHVFDTNTIRFLAAGAATRCDDVNIEELGMPSIAPDHVSSGDVVHLALITDGDTPADWLRTGLALSAANLTCATLGIRVAISDAAQSGGERMLLRSLATPDGQPQLLLEIATEAQGDARSGNPAAELAANGRQPGPLGS